MVTATWYSMPLMVMYPLDAVLALFLGDVEVAGHFLVNTRLGDGPLGPEDSFAVEPEESHLFV